MSELENGETASGLCASARFVQTFDGKAASESCATACYEQGSSQSSARSSGQCSETPCSTPLPDTHCHVAFMTQPALFAAEAEASGAPVFSLGCTPAEYGRLRVGVPEGACVHHGLGLHPWWVPEAPEQLGAQLAEFDRLLPGARIVGEVGLDYSKRREGTCQNQLAAFRHIAEASAEAGGKVLSIHCVRAYEDALRLLRETGCAQQCACIFHWFSGSGLHLKQAIELGCWFSVSERMLASGRGREYAKAIPLERLLLETDAPEAAAPELQQPCVPYAFAQQQSELSRTVAKLSELRRMLESDLAAAVVRNTQALLGLRAAANE